MAKARVFLAPEAAIAAREKAGREELAGLLLEEILRLHPTDEDGRAQSGRLF